MGRALIKLRDTYPDTFVPIDIHGDDSYAKDWGNKRKSFYGVSGYPTLEMDGKVKLEGVYTNDSQQYSWVKGEYDKRRKIATDVTIQQWAENTGDKKYKVTARVGIEEGGAAKSIRVHLIQVLDKYPTGNHYINCFIQAAPKTDITLNPGETTDVSYEFTFDTTSWNKKDYIKIVVIAQTKKDTGPAEVYQGSVMSYPFNDPPPKGEPGDLNCDGVIDFNDIDPFVTALTSQADYETQYPNCDYMLGDINGDGSVDFADIDPFVALLTG